MKGHILRKHDSRDISTVVTHKNRKIEKKKKKNFRAATDGIS